jgi:DNA-binding NarL/FixJ family response regulator
MALERAVKYALGEEEPALVTPARPQVGESPSETLTPREREVAMLVARELTNRQVAKELVISERTVATHVHNILEKLNLHSRVQISAWAVEQDLLR